MAFLPADLASWFAPALAITITSFLFYYHFLFSQRSPFPIVNSYPYDFLNRRAHKTYLENAQELITQGLEKYNSPITLATPSGPLMILPAESIDWVRTNPDLDHQELVLQQYFGNFPGFEANKIMHDDPDNLVINLIKRKLSQNGKLVPILSRHIGEALEELWTENEEWHLIEWYGSTMGLISRAAGAVFAGEKLSRDGEWQRMTMRYATGFFSAAFELMRWPAWTRPVVHWFLPGARDCRKLMRDVRRVMREEVKRREREGTEGKGEIEYFDAVGWSEELAGGKKVDHGAVQLSLAMAALHTTSSALRQVLLDLCEHAELVEPLREEVREAVKDHGVTAAAVAKMHLLDSVMKESQRLGPPTIAGPERLVIRDTRLPDGILLARGSHIAVDQSGMRSPGNYSEPEKFDGYRFYKMREAGDERTAFASSTKEHSVFGIGKYICPGRFLAAVEIKLCLAHILLKYDVRFREGYKPQSAKLGIVNMVDIAAQIEVGRRHDADDVLV
ncbi:Fumitremorgin C monooxygenase [Cercospora beticola]|uniref:Fumitremorgin C monooxygenase n=1 Tax=Cercospora beticola TaxID=122368 RepID=A0A2G5I0A6_CERBT|nr:Fumitremorgin C monooxygenase [Cercospora beticola]PIA97953.1 Fumitremorgin C monooxygenase [Cercospora beticola]WPA97919.1 hypothetical protein RHO25_002530 [Cercospora beticola]